MHGVVCFSFFCFFECLYMFIVVFFWGGMFKVKSLVF